MIIKNDSDTEVKQLERNDASERSGAFLLQVKLLTLQHHEPGL